LRVNRNSDIDGIEIEKDRKKERKRARDGGWRNETETETERNKVKVTVRKAREGCIGDALDGYVLVDGCKTQKRETVIQRRRDKTEIV